MTDQSDEGARPTLAVKTAVLMGWQSTVYGDSHRVWSLPGSRVRAAAGRLYHVAGPWRSRDRWRPGQDAGHDYRVLRWARKHLTESELSAAAEKFSETLAARADELSRTESARPRVPVAIAYNPGDWSRSIVETIDYAGVCDRLRKLREQQDVA